MSADAAIADPDLQLARTRKKTITDVYDAVTMDQMKREVSVQEDRTVDSIH